ncbi:MAG: hypothetical protein RhofKO_08830 [Rhodothermales bacterium]
MTPTLAPRPVYPTQPKALRTTIDDAMRAAPTPDIPGDLFAIIVPDTNRLEGREVAAAVFAGLREQEAYDTVVLVSPSHSGRFRRMTICSVDEYHTPLGQVPISDQVRNELCDEDDDFFLDDEGHFHTEGIDVQLPYLQTLLRESFDIVPIVMGDESPEFCRELGSALGEVMYNRRTLLVVSADFLRMEPGAMEELTTAFEAKDVSRLMMILNGDQLKCEGRGGIVAALIAALHRRANHAGVIKTQEPTDEHLGFFGAYLSRS